MTREEAIDLLDNLIGMVDDNHDSDYDTALKMAIKALEYDDAKYHEEHGEIIVDKAVWEDAKKALEQEPIKDEIILTKEEYGELVSSEFDNGYAKGYREALEQEPMRDATSEERESVDAYIKSVSKPTGIEFDEEQEQLDFVQPHKSIPVKLKVGSSGDAISRKVLISHIENQSREWGEDYDVQQILGDIEDMPSVNPQPTGHWIDCSNGWMCSECHKDNTYDTDFCPNCGARMIER